MNGQESVESLKSFTISWGRGTGSGWSSDSRRFDRGVYAFRNVGSDINSFSGRDIRAGSENRVIGDVPFSVIIDGKNDGNFSSQFNIRDQLVSSTFFLAGSVSAESTFIGGVRGLEFVVSSGYNVLFTSFSFELVLEFVYQTGICVPTDFTTVLGF